MKENSSVLECVTILMIIFVFGFVLGNQPQPNRLQKPTLDKVDYIKMQNTYV